jgi:hypothetical protein
MSLIATVGASLLGIATIPQAVRLLRAREAGGFGWSFAGLNFAGLSLLALRSLVIEEWAFVAINTLTTLFWGLVLVVKATERDGEPPATDVVYRPL